ncbi:carbon-nitrogen hydrolase family protein [Salipiger sp. PrR002]|uniref:carbon-nitrogen hydrolase family protein n=1 Tax=Salipiger sp. PrR002 TaxID=2706489 RepID=UPI0013BB8230|nr:carbon-nitrogen hydrolase family protein [Salipiger sp. PrR002]NDV98413.1 carbon-nitrogen hydrolase family protein [Salipiger sp. PrR002]NDW55125.1 carbon-nitrogen hydrolase family protein [Salipiger sp. PrR004]
MKLALYQGPPIGGDIEAGISRLGAQLEAAAAAGARMLVAPELFLPGYNQPELHGALSQPRGGDWSDRLSGLARAAGCGLCVGWAERDGDLVYNAATCWDADGTELGHYRKIQLFGPMEKASFAPGSDYCLFELEGLRAAMLICYDVEFAAHVKALAERGAELILVPTANPVGFEHVSRVFVPARAAEVGVTIAYANFCGTDAGLSFGGESLIAGPDARPLASAGTAETLLIAEVGTPIAPGLRSTQLQDFREV